MHAWHEFKKRKKNSIQALIINAYQCYPQIHWYHYSNCCSQCCHCHQLKKETKKYKKRVICSALVLVCVRMCVCSCVFVHKYARTCVFMHINAHACVCVHAHRCVCVRVHAHICVCVFAHIHACACVFVHICIYVPVDFRRSL